MEIDDISRKAQEFEVSPSWAKMRRKEFLEAELERTGDEINKMIELKRQAKNQVEMILLESRFKDLSQEYRKVQRQIQRLFQREGNADNTITEEMIERARNYPIQDLLGNQKKGNIRCPFHDDRHPSASIKNNKLHCFSCNTTWNPIDFVMEKEGLNFQEAVRRLERG